MNIHRDMKLLISIAFLAAACGGSTKPAGGNEASVVGSAAAAGAAAEPPNTPACAAVHGKCVTGAAGASCKTTSADECPVGQVCCNN